MTQIVTIIKNDPITGVKYGTQEIPETIMDKKLSAAKKINNIKKRNINIAVQYQRMQNK